MKKTSIFKLAQVKVKTAVDSGKLVKPDNCEECGKPQKNLHGHHEDYEKPLEVIWLCPICHRAKHKRVSRLSLSASPGARRFQEARLKLFETRKEAAVAMGVELSSIEKWEGGSRTIPAYIVKLLNCMEKIQITLI